VNVRRPKQFEDNISIPEIILRFEKNFLAVLGYSHARFSPERCKLSNGVCSGNRFGAFCPYNMTCGGSNLTNFPESCVGLTSLCGDKASKNRFWFILFLNQPFPFLYRHKRKAPFGVRLPQKAGTVHPRKS